MQEPPPVACSAFHLGKRLTSVGRRYGPYRWPPSTPVPAGPAARHRPSGPASRHSGPPRSATVPPRLLRGLARRPGGPSGTLMSQSVCVSGLGPAAARRSPAGGHAASAADDARRRVVESGRAGQAGTPAARCRAPHREDVLEADVAAGRGQVHGAAQPRAAATSAALDFSRPRSTLGSASAAQVEGGGGPGPATGGCNINNNTNRRTFIIRLGCSYSEEGLAAWRGGAAGRCRMSVAGRPAHIPSDLSRTPHLT